MLWLDRCGGALTGAAPAWKAVEVLRRSIPSFSSSSCENRSPVLSRIEGDGNRELFSFSAETRG